MNYRLLTILLWPVFFLYTLRVATRDKSLRYFLQRLGFHYPQQKPSTIWIHCASVGETNTYLPLHLKLLAQYPDTQFVISTNTTTGASTVKRHQLERTTHCYLPIESGFAIKRFLRACKPQQCLIMETEIWPLLYQMCQQRNIPVYILNARLSHRTLSAKSWIKTIYKHALTHVEKILCKSQLELNHFKMLGASEKQLLIAGNLKFTCIDNNKDIEAINLNNRAYCVAASTHNNEEQQLAELWNKLNTDRLLVIAPRHPGRSEQIQKQLIDLKIPFAVRSQHHRVDQHTRVYLADTLGELANFMINADFVFIGGSLVKHGGQNLLEPARLGKAVICGPHMFNFKDEVALLLQHDACLQVKDVSELAPCFAECLNTPERCITMGDKAKKVLNQQSGILDTYLFHLCR